MMTRIQSLKTRERLTRRGRGRKEEERKVVEAYAWDGRNFVKKAVNWALRQIGKRNERLRLAAVEVAGRLAAADDAAARWVGRDALRELTARRTLDFMAAHRR